jgi:hypothetical protein
MSIKAPPSVDWVRQGQPGHASSPDAPVPPLQTRSPASLARKLPESVELVGLPWPSGDPPVDGVVHDTELATMSSVDS